MNDDKFYSWISFALGFSGLLGFVSLCCFLWGYKKNGISFGNPPYLYFPAVIIISFVCNICAWKKIAIKGWTSRFGFFFGILSLLPLALFLISAIFVLIIGPFLFLWTSFF